jgi:hypothetical protein
MNVTLFCGKFTNFDKITTEDYRYRHRRLPAQAGLDRTGPTPTGPGLFYDVIDKNFQKIIPFGLFDTK